MSADELFPETAGSPLRPWQQGGIRPPAVRGSDTSMAAAASMSGATASIRARIFESVRRREGMTCDEIEVALDLRHQTASARIRELVQIGMLRDSGERRPTRSGRAAAVYVAT